MFDRFMTMLAAAAFLACAAPAHAQTSSSAPHVRINLVPERSSIQGDDTFYVAVEQTIDPGWHTYWVNPGDSGQAPVLTWTLPPGFQAGRIEWPAPQKIPVGPLANYGYEKKVTLLQQIVAPHEIPQGPLTMKVAIELLVCNDQNCIPENSSYEFTLNDGAEKDNGTVIDEVYNTLPTIFDWGASYEERDGQFVVMLDVAQPQYMTILQKATDVSLLPEEWGVVENAAQAAVRIEGSLVAPHAFFTQKRGDRPLSALKDMNILVLYQDEAGVSQSLMFRALPAAKKAEALPAGAKHPGGPDGGMGRNKALLFAFIGGIILNLMPCVFPVLSLKALKLCRLSGKELSEARLHGVLYTLGILVCFAAFAAILMSLRAAGMAAGWGFHLQNPAFVLCLSYLLFVIGLNLAGLFEVPGHFANFGGRLADGHSRMASFFTGLLAALVATPCTAPFMATALGFALTQGTIVTLAIFLSLGLGLAFPYLILSFVPACQRAMPRPGAWMDTFRHFLAFPMFAAAAWLAWVYGMQGHEILFALMGAVALAFGLWALAHLPQGGFARFLVVLLALFAIAGAFLPALEKKTTPAAQSALVENGGEADFTRAVFDTLMSGDDPVFVNMTASWCITCKVNERTTIKTTGIRDLFTGNKVHYLRGDWTNKNPEITAFLESYGRNGVPLYVYFGPRDPATHERPMGVVLPQILTPAIVRDAVQKK